MGRAWGCSQRWSTPVVGLRRRAIPLPHGLDFSTAAVPPPALAGRHTFRRGRFADLTRSSALTFGTRPEAGLATKERKVIEFLRIGESTADRV